MKNAIDIFGWTTNVVGGRAFPVLDDQICLIWTLDLDHVSVGHRCSNFAGIWMHPFDVLVGETEDAMQLSTVPVGIYNGELLALWLGRWLFGGREWPGDQGDGEIEQGAQRPTRVAHRR